MSADELEPVYLLSGSDRPKIRRAVARLRARFPAESVELLSADASTGEDAAAACNSLGLFGEDGGHLVVVEGVDRWRAEDATAVAAYLADPAHGSVLALVADAPVKARALVDACAKAGQVLTYEVPKPRDPSVWVRSELERLGVAADADAARALVEVVGDDVTALATEADKLATWAGADSVGRREVESLAVPTSETFVWALTDAWGNRDLAGVLAACESLLERRTKEPFVIAAALASYVGRVRAAQTLAAEGVGSAEVAKRLRMKDFPARKALAHAKNYTREELDDAVVRLAALDAALKGASRLAAELELERALADVTQARERVEA
ncbi:MAG: DNA polymerase III subunit delta [Actinomycetota bacterium]|jgi:DNA polymerase III delta subunit|nr:DNA polymerase III subunit delta [Actinomycetota bacterium]